MIKQKLPQNISATDFDLLIRADGSNPGHCHIEPNDLVTKLWSGEFELWYFDDGAGVALTEQIGDRLNIIRLAGSKIGFRLKELADGLQHRARELNCTSLETMVYSKPLIRALERIGAKQEAVNMVLEF